ncbi:hypothetical protein H1R20_g12295, partial [Candolleomyces eurysporus]
MKIFRKISLKGFNHKVKAKLKAKSCVQLPVDQLSFDESTPSDQGVVVVRLSPKASPPTDGRTFIPRHHSVSFDLEDDVDGLLAPSTKEERVKSWFSGSTGNGVCLSESVCSVMVLNEEEYRAETEGNVQGSSNEDTEYQYHYKLRRYRKEETHGHDLSGSPPVGDLTAQQYAHLRDSGLISTSFDEYRPIPDLESGADDASVQRHPKLQVIFDDDDDNERNSKELFLDAGLWAGPTRTTAISTPTSLSLPRVNPTQRKSIPKSATVDVAVSRSISDEADTGFYMHDNDSVSNLPGSIDSKSTNLFSEEPFSPQFVATNLNGLKDGSFASCDSITTEDNVGGVPDNGVQPSSASIDKFVTDDNLVGTPTRTTAQISLVAPPNTPWDSGTPDTLQLVTRTGQESTRRRSRGTKNASIIPKSMFDKVPKQQSKIAFEEDYSFISFSTPTRVALDGTRKRVVLGGGKKGGGQMVAKAVKAKFNRTFKKPAGNEAAAAPVSATQARMTKASSATAPKRLKSSTPPLSAFPSFANAEVVAVTPVSDSPPVIQCLEKADKPAVAAANGESNHEGDDAVPVSSFVESLNKALDMLECLVDQQNSMAPTLAYVSVTQATNVIATESIYSDPAETSAASTDGSPTPVGSKLGGDVF